MAIGQGIGQTSFSKALEAQQAAIALAACLLAALVTAPRLFPRYAQPCALAHDLALGHLYERRMVAQDALVLGPCLGSQVGGTREGLQKLWAAIRISAVVR